MFDNPVARFAQHVTINGLTFAALILGGLGISEIAENLFIGISVLYLVGTLIMCMLLDEDTRMIFFEKQRKQGEKAPKRSVPQKVDTVVDIALVLTSFAFGFWFCGVIWLFHMLIHPAVSEHLYDPANYGETDGNVA